MHCPPLHTPSLAMKWVARETSTTTTTTTTPPPPMCASTVFSLFLFTFLPFQNRQRNGHFISKDRVTKDISWWAKLTNRLYLERSYGPDRKSGEGTVTRLEFIDLWRQIHWIIQIKKQIAPRAESSSLPVSLTQLTRRMPTPHSVSCRGRLLRGRGCAWWKSAALPGGAAAGTSSSPPSDLLW